MSPLTLQRRVFDSACSRKVNPIAALIVLCSGCSATLSVTELNQRADRAQLASMERVTVAGVVRSVRQIKQKTVRTQLDEDKGEVSPGRSFHGASNLPSILLEDAGGAAELWFEASDNEWVRRLTEGQELTLNCRYDRYDMQRQVTILDGCRTE